MRTLICACNFLILCILFLLSACEKSVDWDLETTDDVRIVVEAILTDENQVQEIFLTETFTDLNGTAQGIEEANVVVEVNEVVYTFLQDPNLPARWYSEVPFAVIDDLNYQLRISWKDRVYTANSELSSVFPIPSPFFNPIAESDSLTLGSFIPPFSSEEQALYQIDIDWRHLNDTVDLAQARVYEYTFNAVDMSQLVRPPRVPVYFPRGSFVQIKKFGLNEDYAAYLRALAIETEWSGTFFYGPSDNLPTNLSDGALGFFSTCAVLVDSLVAE